MSGDLFRSEALEAQNYRLHGDVLVLPSLKLSLIGAGLFVWVLLALSWLFIAEYARQETVQGWLEPGQGVLRVFAESASGKIKRILVKEGESVEKGQPLIIVNGDRVLQDGTHLEERLLAEYRQQKKRISEQILNTQKIHLQRKQELTSQLQNLKQEALQLHQQLELSRQRHALLKAQLNNAESIHDKGHISTRDFHQIVADELNLRSELVGLERASLNHQNQRQKLQVELRVKPQELQNTRARLQNELSDISQKIAQLHGQRAHVIKAPQSGIVSNIQVRQGQFTKTNLPLLTIVPPGESLSARLFVPASAAGFLREGQAIKMRYDAFPYQKFGLHHGVISGISKAAILPNEVHGLAISVKEPVFIVQASLQQSWVKAFGERINLKPGMTFSADVKLAERSLVEWLLEPLYSIKGRLK